MRPIFIAAAALAGVLTLPAAAMARPGFVTTSLNLRAGPSVDFPAVDRVPAGARVNIHGCLAGYAWCDITFAGDRGWIDGDYLQLLYRGRRVLIVDYGPEIDFPIVAFNVGTYWHHYYRGRRFYGRLGYWEHHYDARRGRHENVGRDRHERFGRTERTAPNATVGRAGRSAPNATAGRGGREHVGHERRNAPAGTVGRGVRENIGHARSGRGHGQAAPHAMRPETTGAARGRANVGAGAGAALGGGGRARGSGAGGGGAAGAGAGSGAAIGGGADRDREH